MMLLKYDLTPTKKTTLLKCDLTLTLFIVHPAFFPLLFLVPAKADNPGHTNCMKPTWSQCVNQVKMSAAKRAVLALSWLSLTRNASPCLNPAYSWPPYRRGLISSTASINALLSLFRTRPRTYKLVIFLRLCGISIGGNKWKKQGVDRIGFTGNLFVFFHLVECEFYFISFHLATGLSS